MMRWLLLLLALLVAAPAHAAYVTWASVASNNWTNTATWATIDASSSTGTPAGYGAAGSLQDTEAANTELTTSYTCSTAFQWASTGPAIDAVAVKVANRNASPGSFTFTICLNDNSTGTHCGAGDNTGRETTLLVSDLANLQATNQGWVMVKFAGTVTPVATTNYYVCGKESNAGADVNLYSAATTNWARLLRTTTTGAPAASDVTHILGDWPSDTQTAYTVYVSTADTNNYGQVEAAQCTASNTPTSCCTASVTGASCPTEGITISKGGTLKYGPSTGPAATTSYGLKIQGTMEIFSAGEFDMGKCTNRDYSGACAAGGSSNNFVDASAVATPSTFIMNATANVDTGLIVANGGILNAFGSNVPAIVKDLLAADAANGATTITTTQTTGWLNGQTIVLSSTSRTPGDAESKALTGNCSGTSCAITALATANTTNMCNGAGNFDHCGVAPTQADLGLLSHSLVIQGASASLQGYIQALAGSQVVLRYVESKWLGSATANKRGIDVQATTCATTPCFDMQYSSLHDFTVASSIGWSLNAAASNVTISNNVGWNNIGTTLSTSTTGTGNVYDSNLLVGGSQPLSCGDLLGTTTNNICTGSTGSGCIFAAAGPLTGTISGNIAHSNASFGIATNQFSGGTISSSTAWRNGAAGIAISNQGSAVYAVTLNGLTLFGNTTNNIESSNGFNVTVRGLVSNGDTKFPTTNGVGLFSNARYATDWRFDSPSFDVAAGSGNNARTAHTNDVNITSNTYMQLVMNNPTLSAASPVGGQTLMTTGSFVAFERFNTTTGDHRTYTSTGTSQTSTASYRTASPGELLTPNNATAKLQSGRKRIAIANGATVTPSVYVCLSASWNGGAGCAPRLIRARNDALYGSSDADEVLATGSTSTGTCNGIGGSGWQQLTNVTAAATQDDGVVEVYVDTCGNAVNGTMTVDDWSTD